MPERDFWNCPPRKLWALSKVHVEISDPDGKEKKPNEFNGARKGYIDQVL